MKQIAVYGKGGIGKSTISANLSAALSHESIKVLQIGCDPKHDSTRLLTNGRRVPTVLDYIKDVKAADYKVSDILYSGYNLIGCIEAGGPTPGVGCAGRGILTVFELLAQLDIKKRYDSIVYDVLGDVVCGGFAVPIRSEYAQVIFIVTSGEYMSLYAANNILRGIRNYDANRRRVGGIIYNKRNIENEDEKVIAFSNAVNLPIIANIPRDNAFAMAEKENKTIIESGNSTEIEKIFKDLAAAIISGLELYEARPLDDEELEYSVLGTKKYELITEQLIDVNAAASEKVEEKTDVKLVDFSSRNRFLSKNVLRDEPLHGCAFNGAITVSQHLYDVAVIAHAPKSCSYISFQSVSSSGRRALFERGAILPVSISPNFFSTELTETEMVFGGIEKLREKIVEVKKRSPKAVIVISSCPSGIIGDDIESLKYLSEENMPVLILNADGNLTGDYLQGMLMSYVSLAHKIIKKDVVKIGNTVNVVFEKVVAKNTENNFKVIKNLLAKLDIDVNCRFLCNTSFESLEMFLSAPLNVLAYGDYTGNLLKEFFISEYECEFMKAPFPVGIDESVKWITEIADFFNKKEEAKQLIGEIENEYLEEIEKLKPEMSGKKLFVMTYNHDIDWIIKVACDVGIIIAKIGILNFSQDEGYRTALEYEFEVEENYDREKFDSDIEFFKPDIILTNYSFSNNITSAVSDSIPLCPDVGFYSGIDLVRRWEGMMKHNINGSWRDDERLFKKYYT